MATSGNNSVHLWYLQSARGDLMKRCSEDNWDISWKTSLRSCNINKTTSLLHFSKITLSCSGLPGNSPNISKPSIPHNVAEGLLFIVD